MAAAVMHQYLPRRTGGIGEAADRGGIAGDESSCVSKVSHVAPQCTWLGLPFERKRFGAVTLGYSRQF
jgi:hypothetical protein